MAIPWSEDYATGDADIDEQHKQLFQRLDKLERYVQEGATDEQVSRFLDFLALYARSHFCYEEICMWQRKCAAAEVNKEQHRKLLEAYTNFRSRFDAEGASEDLLKKLYEFLLSWLQNHIIKIDTQLRSCAKPSS